MRAELRSYILNLLDDLEQQFRRKNTDDGELDKLFFHCQDEPKSFPDKFLHLLGEFQDQIDDLSNAEKVLYVNRLRSIMLSI